MIVLNQSPSVQSAFARQVNQKISTSRAFARKSFGKGFVGSIASGFLFDINQFFRKLAGNLGENSVSIALSTLPDSWVMFNSAVIPAKSSKNLTEIDHLIIGLVGIFLVEVKTWKGSYRVERDKWKRREGENWIENNSNPSSQSAYHRKSFVKWISSQFPDLSDDAIFAPVVLTIAERVEINECKIPVLLGANALLEMLLNSPPRLTPEQVQQVARSVSLMAV
ncbi:MAG TPA: nuclease-related domain-containing protein [Leptolyngbyaceae cyanobacterium]